MKLRRNENAFVNFNPRTPRGVRPDHKAMLNKGLNISIHAPREGCDSFWPWSFKSV